jgi:signal transduction histidine kinase
LDGHGLVDALKTMADGLARRTSLKVRFRANEKEVNAPEVEAALYRLAQEALTNTYRHARATEVDIILVVRPAFIHLLVIDNGTASSSWAKRASSATGVGVAGMRERINELGGHLSIRSTEHGTTLAASVRRQVPAWASHAQECDATLSAD